MLDTYAKRENRSIREVWNNLDGTRSLQYTRTLSLPGGFQDRLFETWLTWDVIIDGEGRRTFIVAFRPLLEYNGTHHKVAGTETTVEATSRGIYVVKELPNKNTCEWTWAQQVDLKIAMVTTNMANFFAMQQLGWANEYQEKFKRKGGRR